MESTVIYNPGYPNLYCYSMSCKQVITTEDGYRIRAHVNFMSNYLGALDKITLYDGATDSSSAQQEM